MDVNAKAKVKVKPKPYWLDLVIIIPLFSIGFIWTALTANDLGITYDEAIYSGYALRFLNWLSFTADSIIGGDFITPFSRSAIERFWYAKDMHPPLPKIIAGIGYWLFQHVLDDLTAMRSGTAMLFGALLVAVYLALKSACGRTPAIYTAFAVATMPRVFAHAHFMTLDLPVTTMAFIATVLMMYAIERGDLRWIIAASIALGMALSCKANAFIVPVAVLATYALDALSPNKLNVLLYHRRLGRGLKALMPNKRALMLVPIVTICGLAFLIIIWPWMWYDTIERFTEYLTFHGKHYPVHTFYLGRRYLYAPWHYPLVMTSVTTPTITLLLSIFGAVAILIQWRSTPMLVRIALVSYFAHIAPFCLPHAPKYNGVRLFLPAMPFIAVLAGYAVAQLTNRLSDALSKCQGGIAMRPQFISGALMLLLLAPGLRATLQVHPYELSFYNALVGGTRGATYRWGFECTYWGVNFAQLLPFLNRLPDDAIVFIIPAPLYSYLMMYVHGGALKPTLQFVSEMRDLGKADYIMFQASQTEIITNKVAWKLWRTEEPTYAAVYDGVPITAIYDRSAILRAMLWSYEAKSKSGTAMFKKRR